MEMNPPWRFQLSVVTYLRTALIEDGAHLLNGSTQLEGHRLAWSLTSEMQTIGSLTHHSVLIAN